MSAPDFYLASSEGYGLEEPRQCWCARRLKTGTRDDLLLVKIDPPLLGQNYGRKQDVEHVILATRHKGRTLFPISEWPAYVHVAIPLVANPEQREEIQPDEYHLIGWAELYQTEEDAGLRRWDFRRSKNRNSHTGRTGDRAMRGIRQYWRLVFLPFALLSLWTAHVCVTQFEPTRRAIVLFTVLAIVVIVALGLLRQARVRRDG